MKTNICLFKIAPIAVAIAFIHCISILNTSAQVFFYNAKLDNGEGIVCKGFDMDFHIDTYKILQEGGFLDSMFVRQNEKELEKIDNMNWTYSAEFSLSRDDMKKPNATLYMENLDGNCTIYINNKKLGYFNNSFMEYALEVKHLLKKGRNNIRLEFSPKNPKRTLQRSPQYLYGWDWYPKTLAPRIGSIYLAFENDNPIVEYSNIQTRSIHLNDDGTYSADLMLNLHFRTPLKENHKLILMLKDNHFTLEKELSCGGSGEYRINFSLDTVSLWYPNGMGNQVLYSYTAALDSLNNQIIYPKKFGVRTIKLVREYDKSGQSFYFVVNNEPFFAKGANYIMTYGDVMDDITQASAANINMFRIWGGSDYGSEEFYSLCDEYGIMVWQDYPYACDIYPGDDDFLNNARREAAQNLMHITSHPSLALLCGNNEIWEAWYNWGMQDTIADTLQAFRNYTRLFKETLMDVSHEYAPTIDYIHSSPMEYGWGHEESLKIGDCHYWGVWWGDSTFETYTRKVPRFMSEFGFQGAMNPETAETYTSHPYSKDNEDFSIHQKHNRGFLLIDNRIKEWFDDAKTDDEYILFSQSLQQEAAKTAIEALRINKPYCMGSLIWQYNEPYPCIGWGALDYSSVPKPVYYTLQKVYAPLIFAFDKSNEDTIKIYACSDLMCDTNLSFAIKFLDNEDREQFIEVTNDVKIKKGETKLLKSIATKSIPSFDKSKDYIWVEGYYGDEVISDYAFFVHPKDYIAPKKYFEIIMNYYFPYSDN